MRSPLCLFGLHRWRITEWITYAGVTKRKTVACERPGCLATKTAVNRKLV